jgi:hypothetical protein
VPGDGLEAQPVPVHAPALLALLGSSSVGLDRLAERRFLLRTVGLRARELCGVSVDAVIKSNQFPLTDNNKNDKGKIKHKWIKLNNKNK